MIYSMTRFWSLIVVVVVLLVDQVSKWWILAGLDLPSVGSKPLLPFMSLTMVWNPGISMGLPIESLTGDLGLILITGAVTVWLVQWLWRTDRSGERLPLALIIGGAVGNLIDRLLHGAVVDFIHLHWAGYDFYVFNIADAAITVGVILLLVDGFFGDRLQRAQSRTKTGGPQAFKEEDRDKSASSDTP